MQQKKNRDSFSQIIVNEIRHLLICKRINSIFCAVQEYCFVMPQIMINRALGQTKFLRALDYIISFPENR